jgi:hypothetical protein
MFYSSIKRGIRLLNGRRQVLLQDDISGSRIGRPMAHAHKRHNRAKRDIGDTGARWQEGASVDPQCAQRRDFQHGAARPLQQRPGIAHRRDRPFRTMA